MSLKFPKILTLTLVVMTLAACSGKSSPPAADLAAAAQPKAGLEGQWKGDSGPDMPFSFSVADNQVSDVYASLKARKGNCSVFGSFGSEGSSPVSGKAFTAHGKHDQFEFTVKGSFTSDTEASGTIDWKTNSDICGPYDTQIKWTAKKGPAEAPSDDE